MNKNKIILLVMLAIGVLFVLSLGKTAVAQNKLAARQGGSIKWGGLERTYFIYVPSSYNRAQLTPLVIALHGGGGSGRHMQGLTRGGFNRLSEKEGFIVAYPDGIEKNWNDGRGKEETGYRTHKENIDDVGFISALIDNLVKEFNVDPKRVYVTGISNGAMMSYRLGIELPVKIAAIAPVAGNIPENLLSKPLPAKPISVLAINNTNDLLMPYKGGSISGFFGIKKLGRVLSVTKTMEYWIKNNQCSTKPVITYEPDKDSRDGTRVKKEVYGNGKNNTEVIIYSVEGAGHTWPSGMQYLPERFIGKTSKDIDANEVIWNFFKKHERD